MKKNVILLILSIILVPSAWAFQYTHQGNTLEYTIIDNVNKYVSVKASTIPITPTLIIPDKVTFESTEYSVTAIEPHAFDGCTQITSLVLPNTLESIGSLSFYRCKLLTQITIPNQVNFIGSQAFLYCTRLKTIEFKGTDTIPHNVSKITDNIADIILLVPNGYINTYVQSWRDPDLNIYEKSEKIFSTGGFIYTITNGSSHKVSIRYGCSNSSALIIADNVAHKNGYQYSITSVDSSAFYKTDYSSIVLGNNIETIGIQAFARMENMVGKTVTFPTSVKYIDNNAFIQCASEYKFLSNTPPELGDFVYGIFSQKTASTSQEKEQQKINDGSVLFTIPSCEVLQSITANSNTNWNYPFFINYVYTKDGKCSYNITKDKANNFGDIPTNKSQEEFGKITYTRFFKPGVWETLYLPFELEDMTVTVQGVNDGKPFSVNNPWNNDDGGYFHLAQLGSDGYFEYIQDSNAKLKGKNPYIIQFPSEDFKDVPVTFSSKDNYNHIPNSFEQADPTSDYAMYANTTLQPQKLNNPAYYLGTDNNFKHTGTYTLQPFECYLTPIVETQSYVNPRMMSVRFRPQSGITTDVSTINNNPLLCQRNGNTLIIQTNGNPVNIYNINGLLLHSFAEGQEEVSVTLNSGCYIINSLGYTEKIIF